MFRLSTKIVVIGSNVKRKAGPRVGSTGYILAMGQAQSIPQMPGCVLFNTQIIFTRYGYEQRLRIEKTPALLVMPEVVNGANPKKALNKAIRALKKYESKSTLLVVAPIKDSFDTSENLTAKVICRLGSNDFVDAVNKIHMDPFGSFDEYWSIPNLLNVMPEHVRNFGYQLTAVRKFNHLAYVVSKYYRVDNLEHVRELFTFIDICEVLSTRFVEHKGSSNPWRKKFGIHPMLKMSNLFNIYEFNQVSYDKNKEIETADKLPYKNLATEMQHKGSTILNKHT